MVYLTILSSVLLIQSHAFSKDVKGEIKKPLDLTWAADVNSTAWPNTENFKYIKSVQGFREDGSWYAAKEFCTGEHVGTHIDPPYHFNQYGWKVAEIPLENLFVKGVIIDVTEEVRRFGRDAELTVQHIKNWEQTYGCLPEKCVVLVRFGWSKFYGNLDQYLGKNGTHFPGISKPAAEYLVNIGKVVGIGVDTASVDKGRSTSFDAHKILAAKQIYGLENVKIPENLPEIGFDLVILPMKLQLGSGGPVRIIALPNISDNPHP